jgi:NAD(P)-dependent dehydrogenase (short-subunit alcohol dehydrogenase family)
VHVHNSAAVVTGGASGLGLATVKALLDKGAKVVIIDLPSSDGAAVANELGERARFAAADVTESGAVGEALDLADSLGAVRIAVNCAGTGNAIRVLGKKGPFLLDRFAAIVTINLIGTFNVLRLAAERIAKNPPIDGDRGVIINTASVGQAAYSASKGGVAAMTLPLARDLASSLIRVVTIAPGTFDTPVLALAPEELKRSLGAQIPHPSRLGRPEEFGALAVHIVENLMLNGEVIRLDGAIRMAPR